MSMANKKSKGTRFTLPSKEDLDKSLEKIPSGSTFLSRSKAKSNDVEKTTGLKSSKLGHTERAKANQKNKTSNKTESNNVSVCTTANMQSNEFKSGIDDANTGSTKLAGEKVETFEAKNSALATESGVADQGKETVTEREEEHLEGSDLVSHLQTSAPMSTKTTNSIIVNARQRGNPILKHIRNVPWEYGEIIPDYVLGQTTCALFLSLRYHNFNPDYIHDRLKQLGHRFQLRILLVQVDVKDPHASLKELSKMCILADCTLILAWSAEEAGRYLETYKSYENKPADVLQERVDGDYQSKMIDCLTSVKSVNKTDAVTLMSNFGSLKNILQASKEEISLCPGFGPQKAERLFKICHEPFIKKHRGAEHESSPLQKKKQKDQES